MPTGVDPSIAWVAVALSRQHKQEVPLQAYGGARLNYWIPPQHLEWLSTIDQRAGGSIGARHPQPIKDDDNRYLFNSLMEEAIASSQLEGASTTREVAKELLRSGRRPRDRAEQMIYNNYRAIMEIRDLKRSNMTPALLCHLQQILTADTLDKPDAAGRFRWPDEAVRVVDAFDNVLYTPPPGETVEQRIKEICDFANTRTSPFIHPVLKAIALHFAIGFVHPFVDGNGRTARALFYWFMLKNDYWMFEYLPISRIINAAPVKYARAYLYTETDGGDLTYFNDYHLKVVIRAINELHDYLARQQKQKAEVERLLEDYPQLNYRQKAVIVDAIKHPNQRYTVQEHRGKFRVAYNTASADLTTLRSLGLLEQTARPGGGKGRAFRAAHDLIKRLKKPPPQERKKERAQPAARVRRRTTQQKDQPSLFDAILGEEAKDE
jgi:Fic family protein